MLTLRWRRFTQDGGVKWKEGRKKRNVLFNNALHHQAVVKRMHYGIITVNRNVLSASLKEGNVLFNNALNTFYLRLYGVKHMVEDHSDSNRGNRCCHMGYSFRLTARVLLYASSHRQDNTYHGLCYTSRGALAGTRTSLIASLNV